LSSESEKPPRRMTCRNCPRYSRDTLRCLEGKANPRRKSDSVAVAETLGLRALCHYNPYREPMAMRMFFPTDPRTIRDSARRKKRAKRLVESQSDAPTEMSAPASADSAARE
jgi:hypothetical protein